MTDSSAIREWLVERLATYLDREPQELDARTPLASYGLDSVYAQSIATELSERLRIEFDTQELIKHNTIDKIVARVEAIQGAQGRDGKR